MTTHPIYDAAMGEVRRLKVELLASTASALFQEFLKAQDVVRMYEAKQLPAFEAPPPPRLHAPAANTKSEHARVVAAAKEFLRQRRERCTSSVITSALELSGVAIGGKNRASRVSGYLSGAKDVFDNVRGEGYGLHEWKNGAAH